MEEDVDALPRTIGRPATRTLTQAGFARLADLDGADPRELLRLHGVGPKAVRLLAEALEQQGRSFSAPSPRR